MSPVDDNHHSPFLCCDEISRWPDSDCLSQSHGPMDGFKFEARTEIGVEEDWIEVDKSSNYDLVRNWTAFCAGTRACHVRC